jgi:hypothetical protein
VGQSQRLLGQYLPGCRGWGKAGLLLQLVQPFCREGGRRREKLAVQLLLEIVGVLLDPFAGSLLVEDAVDPGVVSGGVGAAYVHFLQRFGEGLRHCVGYAR